MRSASSSPVSARPRRWAATSPRPGRACWPAGRASRCSPTTGSTCCRCHIAAPVAVEPSEVLPVPQTKRMDRSGQFALIAAREAWARRRRSRGRPRAQGRRDRLRHRRRHHAARRPTTRSRSAAPAGCSPMTVPMLMPNGPAAVVGLELTARAGVHTPVSACSSGAEAIAYAVDMIRVRPGRRRRRRRHRGRDPRAAARRLRRHAGAVHPQRRARAGVAALRQGPGRLRARRGRRRPGPRDRSSTPRARGATVYAEVAGHGITSDAHHMAQPDPVGAGAARAMQHGAYAAPAPSRRDVVHINAHATSTPVGDVAEDKAIRAALGDATDGACVAATKSMTGHLLGAAGAVEAIATILALHHRTAPADDQPRGPRRRRHARRRPRRARQLPDGRPRASTTPSASAATTSPSRSGRSEPHDCYRARPPRSPSTRPTTRATRVRGSACSSTRAASS